MSAADFDLNSPESLRVLCELAERAARAGGAVARDWFRRDYNVRRKPDGTEVSDADDAAQADVLACLRAARPHDAVIAEEAQSPASGPQGSPFAPSNEVLCWVIDPLDGTRNYVRGIPIYVCSVAAMIGGYPIVGAVYDPERDTTYSASRAARLLLDGRPPPSSHLAAARRAGRKPLVGIPSSLQGAAFDILQGWRARVVIRNLGATALHLAMVAVGQLQAALISDSRLWDIAAGWLMVTVTGGLMTALDGSPIFPLDVARYADEAIPSLAASDPATHARLLPPGARPL